MGSRAGPEHGGSDSSTHLFAVEFARSVPGTGACLKARCKYFFENKLLYAFLTKLHAF